jgi:tetratricopeptide (TPR) repeat protein
MEKKLTQDLLLESLGLLSSWIGESASLTCTTMTWLTLFYLEHMLLEEAETMINRLSSAESQAPHPHMVALKDVQVLQGHSQMRKHNIDNAVSIFQHCTDLYANKAGISNVGTISTPISGVEAMLMQGNIEDATQIIYDAESISKGINSPRALALRIKWNMARHSMLMGEYGRALSRYKDLCEEHERYHDHAGSSSRRWEALHCALGEIYLKLGDLELARVEYEIGNASTSRKTLASKSDPKNITQWLIYGSLERTKVVPLVRMKKQGIIP